MVQLHFLSIPNELKLKYENIYNNSRMITLKVFKAYFLFTINFSFMIYLRVLELENEKLSMELSISAI